MARPHSQFSALHPTRRHNARNLGSEVEVAYPFHPLFGRPAIVVADQLHNGSRHLTLRIGDQPSFLVPAWMVDPDTASVKVVQVPRLSIAGFSIYERSWIPS